MDENAEKLFNALPKDGSSVTGGVIQEETELTLLEYRKAKAALKEAGVVTLGRGRGGKISRVEGAELPPEPVKLSKAQQMALAREEKQARTREQKGRDLLRDKAYKEAYEEHSDADEIQVQVWNVDTGKCFVTVWKDKEGKVITKYV